MENAFVFKKSPSVASWQMCILERSRLRPISPSAWLASQSLVTVFGLRETEVSGFAPAVTMPIGAAMHGLDAEANFARS